MESCPEYINRPSGLLPMGLLFETTEFSCFFFYGFILKNVNQELCANKFRMKSASNGGIFKRDLQMLRIVNQTWYKNCFAVNKDQHREKRSPVSLYADLFMNYQAILKIPQRRFSPPHTPTSSLWPSHSRHRTHPVRFGPP